MKSAAELVLPDTARDNNRKRDVYCRLSTPFILAQKLHRVPALPPVHSRKGSPAHPGRWQAARKVAFVLGREVELEKLLQQAARKMDIVFLRAGECT